LALFKHAWLKLDLFDVLPHSCAEELSYYVLQAVFGVIHHNCANCDEELDDKVLISESCNYLNNVLSKLLHPRFNGDMFNFKGYMLNRVHKKLETVNSGPDLNQNKSGLLVFNPGLFIIDRQNPDDDLSGEPHKISLCWNQPQILIDLVEKAPMLTSLNLIGYEELTDLALEYISGKVGNTSGLKSLNEITLPKKCFVTPEGLRVLIENLPRLEVIENQGKMGVMLQNQHLVLPTGQKHFLLKEFCQMESVTSGGLEDDEVENNLDEEMTSWCPTKEDLLHLQTTCPNIRSLKLLMNDKDILNMAKLLDEDCIDFDICQLEIHHINPDFVSTGINRLSVIFANSLVSLKLTILDHLSWHSIQIIGKYCLELKVTKFLILIYFSPYINVTNK